MREILQLISAKYDDKLSSISNSIHITADKFLDENINNSTKNFYFTKVVSDLDSYPRVQFPKEKSIRTPLNIDIFCDRSNSYCQDRKIFDNSNNTPRSQLGWYLSINHNKNRDGNITQLTSNPNIVSISSYRFRKWTEWISFYQF